jgi:hypothetical protein
MGTILSTRLPAVSAALVAVGLVLADPTACPGQNAPRVRDETESHRWQTLRGRVVFQGEPPARAVIDPQKDREIMVDRRDTPILSERLVVDPEGLGVANALVYLVRPTAVRDPARRAVPEVLRVSADRGVFAPHVIAAMEGTRILVETNDPLTYNFNVRAPIASARIPSYGRAEGDPSPDSQLGPSGRLNVIFGAPGEDHGKTVSVAPRATRWPIPVRDDIHPWMSAWWMVFDHPYFAVTDSCGRFTIRDAPTGPQRIAVWHESLNPTQQGPGTSPRYVFQGEVVVEHGSTRLVNFAFEPRQLAAE